MGVVLVGSYLVVINTTIPGIALPDIARDFGSDGPLGVDWVITVYLLAVIAVQPGTGWLADRWGHKRVYLVSLSVFAVGSLLCTAAPNLPLLLTARVVQGAGGGTLIPLGMAMTLAVFPPHRRGFVLGVRGVAVMAGPALGPPLAGLIIAYGTWRLVFAALAPFAVAGVFLAAALLHDPGGRSKEPSDPVGWTLAFVGVALVVVGARQLGAGLADSPLALLLLLAGVLSLVFLARRSLRRDHPVMEFRLFAVPVFSVSLVLVWMITVLQFARLNFLPVELQIVRGLSAQEVGLIMIPAAAGVAATMPFGGWLADRAGARVPLIVGLLAMCWTSWELSLLQPATSLRLVVVLLVVQGLGTGLMRIPLHVAGLNALQNRYITQASAIRNLNRQAAGAVGTAVLAAAVVAQLGSLTPDVSTAAEVARAQAAYNQVFRISFYLVVVALVGALFMPGRRQMRDLQAQRAAEYHDGE